MVPGGQIDDNESLEEGALRELQEECGIDFQHQQPIVKPIMVYETNNFRDNILVSAIVIYYLIKVKELSKNIKLKLQPAEV